MTRRIRALFLVAALVCAAAAGVASGGAARAGELDCKSYVYDCTPGYTANNAQGTWAWSHYGDIPGNDITDQNGRNHNCTLYAAWRLQQSGMTGDPGNWGDAATWAGRIGGGNHSPAVGSIAWWGTERGGGSGHVAYVEQVSGDQVFLRADNFSYTVGYTSAGWIPASSVDLFLHPHDLAGGGRQPDGTFLQYGNGIYRVAGGSVVPLSSCASIPGGCTNVVVVDTLAPYAPTISDGELLIQYDNNGGGYVKAVGGALVDVTSCESAGSVCSGPTVVVNNSSIAWYRAQHPTIADGELLVQYDDNGGGYVKAAGGALVDVTSCDSAGSVCSGPTVVVNGGSIAAYRMQHPTIRDGELLVQYDGNGGGYVKAAGGTLLDVSSCQSAGSVCTGPTVVVNAGTIAAYRSLHPVLADGAVLIQYDTAGGGYMKAAGAALLPILSCDSGMCDGATVVNGDVLTRYAAAHPAPVDDTVVAGVPSGREVVFEGGCATATSNQVAVANVDDVAFDGLPRCLSVTATTAPGAVWKTPYSTTLTASGGNGALTWSVASGKLPGGLTLDPSGVVSGSPTAAGTFRFTVRVSDSASPVHSATKAMTIQVAAIAIAPASVPAGVVGKPVSTQLSAQGGSGTRSWSVTSGTLPAGVTLSGTGRLTGTPTAAGTFRFVVSVSDSASPSNTASRSLQLVVAPIAMRTATLKVGSVGRAYSQTLLAWGGTAPLAWKLVSGPLPAGLTLSRDGVLAGTPTTAGDTAFTVRVADAQGKTATAAFTVHVG